MLPLFLSITQIFGGYAEQAASESIGSATVPAVEPSQDSNVGSAAAPLGQMQIHSIVWYTMLGSFPARSCSSAISHTSIASASSTKHRTKRYRISLTRSL